MLGESKYIMATNQNSISEKKVFSKEITTVDNLIVDRLLKHITQLESRLATIENSESFENISATAPLSHTQDLDTRVSYLQSELTKVNARAASMRLDRQLKLAVKRVGGRVLPNKSKFTKPSELEQKRKIARVEITRKMTVRTNLAVICGAYPGGSRAYGGQFIKSRMDFYRRAGIKAVVVEVSSLTKECIRHEVDGVDVLRVNPAGFSKVLRLSNIKCFGVHSIEKPVWVSLKPHVDAKSFFVWVHGFEARAWQELAFNFSKEDLENLYPRLENANRERRQTMSEVMKHANSHVIYVSHYMRAVAEGFTQSKANNTYVIPNPVDPKTFPYFEKSADARKSILWLRSFSAHNYANDISRDVLLGLTEKPWFSDLKVTIIGQGKYFAETTIPFEKFPNVNIREDVVSRKEMRSLFNVHGVKLVPSRWDSQGLTACEAMHSGLVPLTSSVAGLREYIDSESAIIAEFGESTALIDGYSTLYENPDLYLKMSAAAHKKSKILCGPSNTTQREIRLIKTALKKKN